MPDDNKEPSAPCILEASASGSVTDARLADLLSAAAAAATAEAEVAAKTASGTAAVERNLMKEGAVSSARRFIGSVFALPLGPAELQAYGSLCRCVPSKLSRERIAC